MNIVENFLLHQLDLSLKNRHFAGELILKNDFTSEKLLTLIHRANERQKVCLLCFCDTFFRKHLWYFKNIFQNLIDLADNENHETNKRSLTNIYISMLKSGSEDLSAEQKNQLTEICFTWLIGESLVATKSNCITCLDLLSNENQWIADELVAVIEQMYPQMTVSFQSRAKKILKRKKRLF